MSLVGTRLYNSISKRMEGHGSLPHYLAALEQQYEAGERSGRGRVNPDAGDFNDAMTWAYTLLGSDYWEIAQRTFRQCGVKRPTYAAIYD